MASTDTKLAMRVGGDDAGTTLSSISGQSGSRATRNSASLYDHGSADSEALLFGREAEIGNLQEAFRRVSVKGASSEVLLLSGPSGSGKSSLAQSLRQPVSASGFFVDAKFDQTRLTLPFMALSSVLSDLCDLVVQDKEHLSAVRSRILALKKAERLTLSSIVSNFSQVTGEDYYYDSVANMAQSFKLFKVACKLFLRAIATEEKPIVMFLDDLQWADIESLWVLKLIATDKRSQNLLLVVAYRTDDTSPMTMAIEETFGPKQKNERVGSNRIWLRQTHLEVMSLDTEAVNEFVSGKLSMDPTSTTLLSDLLLRRTHGNPFFLNELLKSLVNNNLVCFRPNSSSFTWDLATIQREINVTDNVLRLLEQRLHRLSSETQELLTVGAMIGFTFRKDVLFEFIAREGDGARGESINEFLSTLLEMAVKDGLIEEVESGEYCRFSHDKIQQCLLESVELREGQGALRCRLGWYLHSKAEQHGDEVLFAAADNLNQGIAYVTEEEKIDFANTNLEAATAARNRSSFHFAAECARRGLSALGTNLPWGTSYELTLNLCILVAQSEYCLGDFGAAINIANTVIVNAKTNLDKVPAYKVSIDAVAGLGEISLALDKCIEVARELGDFFPTKKHPVVACTLAHDKTKKLMARFSDDEILNLPLMEDTTALALTQIHQSLQLFAMMLHRDLCVGTSYHNCLHLSFQHGCSYMTPSAIATFGMSCYVFLGDRAALARCTQLALEMQAKFKFKQGHCRTALLTRGCCLHYTENMTNSVLPIRDAIVDGLASGDIEETFFVVGLYAYMCFNSGIILSDIVDDLTGLHEQFSEHKHHNLLLYKGVLTLALSLMDKTDDSTTLDSFVMEESAAFREAANAGDKVMLACLQGFKMLLLFQFGNTGRALDYVMSLIKIDSASRMNARYYVMRFYCGLVLFQQARDSRKRKYASLARRKSMKIVRKFRDSPNAEPLMLLLEAENAVARRRPLQRIQEMYDSAIECASRERFVSIEAMANERAAYAILYVNENATATAQVYLTRAIELYDGWNAYAKVIYLEEVQQTITS